MNARGHVRDRFLNYPSGSLHTFSVLAGALTHLRVSIWWGGFCYIFTALDSTGGICISRLFIKIFYYTFVDIFRNLHMFKNVNWFFKSNRLAVKNQGFVLKMSFAILFFLLSLSLKPLHIRLIARTIRYNIKQNFIQFSHSIFFQQCWPMEQIQVLVKINQTSRVSSNFKTCDFLITQRIAQFSSIENSEEKLRS